MRLDRLLDAVPTLEVRGDATSADVTAISHASGEVRPGTLFSCLAGARVDGHEFAAEAVASGAVALLVERALDLPVPQVVVGDVRAAMGPMAAALAGHPARALRMLGVTGTNGKTTTVHLLAAVLASVGVRVEQIGTLHPAGGLSGPPNTPDATVLQPLLAGLVDAGATAVAMEVSSHALVHRRVDGIVYDVAGFTNLSQDHLDFHGTMEEYFEAKASLFTPERASLGVVNADDPYGRQLLDRAAIKVQPYSMADVDDLDVGLVGSTFRWRGLPVTIDLGGEFNVANALCAALMALACGLDDEQVAAGLSAAGPVPGRFEAIDAGQPFTVVVDYAHTPDGLEKVLETARAAAGGGRLIVVFGCGGDKDRGKRPQMGAIAERLADQVVITSDNPRSESPESIIAEIRAGIVHPGSVDVDPDRRSAMARAFRAAQPGDLVVVAGKGHETGQEIAGLVHPFDDRDVARDLLGGAPT
ncbi:MAG: UDP-N-acetylmuramoyl-L-alanyl-D-glutamate--2,6-diaminopimelate ligase [Acidimicrobiales bacterium]